MVDRAELVVLLCLLHLLLAWCIAGDQVNSRRLTAILGCDVPFVPK